MGQIISYNTEPKSSSTEQPQKRPLSEFYEACHYGDFQRVQTLLLTMSLEQINSIEPNGSTALHVASYHGHADIVRILLATGACRTIKNIHKLTAYEEALNEDIQKLFTSISPSSSIRFIGSSPKTEWSLDTSQAAAWKTHLSGLLQPELSFKEMVLYLREHYLTDYMNLPPYDFQKIKNLFRNAYEHNDVTYIVQAYTSATQFHVIINNHLAQNLLTCFRLDSEQSILEQCVAHLASIFIHRLELKTFGFIGITYRGLLLLQSDLEIYTVNKHLLNKSFLSTSKDRSIASIYAGSGDGMKMRRKADKTPLQYTALCIYKIRNLNTALDISSISEIPHECEVLIMPLCAFQVRSVRKNEEDNNDIQFEIELEECEDSTKLETKTFSKEKRRRVT
ncbi:hypothetical protein I4U23_010404 [Adineta vaga]|nr:hypothetical protein I4U23_010404 [Adineta vaga]